MTQVFISYSRKDLAFVEKFSTDLKKAGLDVWWDLNSIQGSDLWEKKIEEGLRTSQFYIVVMTPEAMDSRWVQREYIAADWMGLPIIPIKYKECQIPLTLRDAQLVNAVGRNYEDCLAEVIGILGAKQGTTLRSTITENSILIDGWEFLRIPAGEFIMGSREDQTNIKTDGVPVEYEEKPDHKAYINYDYWLGKYPITNMQYNKYLEDSYYPHPVPDWQNLVSHPVVNVSWNDAKFFSNWFNEKFQKELNNVGNLTIRLPTEAEWEKAARGPFGNEFPWGNSFDKNKCNLGKGSTTAVGSYSANGGDSPYGCADMLGNVWEWCQDLFNMLEYKDRKDKLTTNPFHKNFTSNENIVRGGSFNNAGFNWNVHCATRYHQISNRYSDTGFRLCLAPKGLAYKFR